MIRTSCLPILALVLALDVRAEEASQFVLPAAPSLAVARVKADQVVLWLPQIVRPPSPAPPPPNPPPPPPAPEDRSRDSSAGPTRAKRAAYAEVRTLELGEVRAVDRAGNQVDPSVIAARLAGWTSVLVCTVGATDGTVQIGGMVETGGISAVAYLQALKPEGICILLPWEKRAGAEPRDPQGPEMPPPPELTALEVSQRTDAATAQIVCLVYKPVWETRERPPDQDAGTAGRTYKVCKWVPDQRVWTGRLSALTAFRAGGENLDPTTLPEVMAKPTIAVLSRDGEPVHPLYTKCFSEETVVVILPRAQQ